MKSQTFYLSCIFLWLMLFQEPCSCSKTTTCFKEYQFTFPVSIQPTQDTLNIGDTLWVGMEIPKGVINEVDSQMLIIEDSIDFSVKMTIDMLDSFIVTNIGDTILYSPTTDFEIVKNIGEVSIFFAASDPHINYFELFPDKSETGQKIHFGLLPSMSGKFTISFGNLTRDLEDIILQGNCEAVISKLHYNVNELKSDNNYHIFEKEIPSKWYASLQEYKNFGGFSFVVK